MSDNPDNDVLDYLRAQFERVHVRFDRIEGDLANLKTRMSGLELEVAHMRVGMAELNGRLDRLDSRVAHRTAF